MKTQIQDIINGAENVIRMENHPKYINSKVNSCGNFVGTAVDERNAIGEKIFAENGDEMRANIRGVELTLHRHSSSTGKTSWYSSELTPDEYAIICTGNTFEWPADMKFKSFDITIGKDCTVTVTRYGKKSEGATWKAREWNDLDGAFVTIKE
jgi:hypothetical protein